MPYHHGNLRQTLLDEAVLTIEESGVDALSLRDLARRAGVSHAAPAHHFGDRAGLLTAIAIEGFQRLADRLEQASDSYRESGVAYVRFAVSDRGRFEVMFRSDLLRHDDPDLAEAMQRAAAVLSRGATKEPGDARLNALAAWSIVHGFATLWNAGAVRAEDGVDADALARDVAGVLFAS